MGRSPLNPHLNQKPTIVDWQGKNRGFWNSWSIERVYGRRGLVLDAIGAALGNGLGGANGGWGDKRTWLPTARLGLDSGDA